MSTYISPLMWLCLFVTLLPIGNNIVKLVACCMGIALALVAMIGHY